MATPVEYQQRIGMVVDWTGVDRLWHRIVVGDTPGWDSGKAFEYLVLRAFQLDGAEVRFPFEVRLFGESTAAEQIDGVIHLPELSCLVESKDVRDRVSFDPIAKMRNQLLRRPASAIGVVFSRGGFTAPATMMTHFCVPQAILLWSGEEFEHAIRHDSRKLVHRLRRKLRYFIEMGFPDFDTREEDLP